jgi:hypothetical protein
MRGRAGGIEHAQGQVPGVQIDAAVKSVLTGIESHHGLRGLGRPEPASWLPALHTPAERSTLGRGSHWDPAIQLGAVSTHPLGGHEQYPAVALDRAGMTVFRDITFLAAGPARERSR